MYDTVFNYLDDYRAVKAAALQNQRRARWFVSAVATLPDLFDTVFNTTDDNKAWTALYDLEAQPIAKLSAALLRIHHVAGCRHDLREQFAVDTAHEPKGHLDFDRHTIMTEASAQFANKLIRMMLVRQSRDL